MSVNTSIAHNYLIQIIGRFVTLLVGLVTVGVLTRVLSPDAFGSYTTALAVLQFFGVIVDFGLTLTYVVMLSESGRDESRVTSAFVSLRLLSGIVVFTVAPLVTLALPYSNTIRAAVAVGAVGYVCMAAATMLVGLFQKHAVIWRASLAELTNRVALLALIAIFALFHAGPVAMLVAVTLANILWLVVTYFLARPYVRIRPTVDTTIWKDAVTRSWPIALSIFFNLIYLRGDILLISLLRPQTDVAIYGVAYKLIDVLTALPVMFMGLLLPPLVAAWSTKDLTGFRSRLSSTFDLFALLCIPIVVGTQVVSVPLIQLIAGAQYDDSGLLMRVLGLALIPVFFGALYGHAVVAVGRQKQMMWGYAGTAILSVIAYLIVIPRAGIYGAAWVTIVSETIVALLTFFVVYASSRALPSLRVTIKALVASLVMYLTLRALPAWPVLVAVTVGAGVYVGMLFALRAITLEKLRALLPSRV